MNKKALSFIIFLVSVLWFLVTPAIHAESLNRAEVLYLQGSYSDSINECAVNISRNKNVDEAYYLLGLNYLKINDTEKAREKLKFFLDNFKASKYMDNARLAYADSFFLEQRFPEAREIYEEMLRKNSALAPTAILRLGQCALKTGNWQEAKNYFDSLKQKYPLSLEAKQADTLTQADVSYFTIQVGAFANSRNAQKLKDKLQGKNFDAYIDEFKTAEGILYRVRVGRLSSRQEAESLKSVLEKEGYPTKIFP